MRRLFYLLAWLLLAACARESHDFSEATIAGLHDRMQRGEVSAERLTRWYLERIETVDRSGPGLNAIVEINPDAIEIARALDAEWRDSGPRGPMHGIPVILKANIDTGDGMHTTAGSLALASHRAPADAPLVDYLRRAGAVILGKANLSEWANFRSRRSSSGWSSIGGQTKNPYDTLRNPCGSSSGSGVAVAANLTMVAVGTETDGSVVCPSGINGIVGIKPTLGLISAQGIIPIAHSQDTAGPMARSVRDAAILLGAMSGTTTDYTGRLAADGLSGKRIGVIRSYSGADSNPGVETLLTANIQALQDAGATIVDEIRIDTEGMRKAEYEVLLYEFKADLNAYLETSNAPLRSLTDVIAFNDERKADVMPIFGQDILHASEEKGPLTEDDYLAALEDSKRIAKAGLDTAFAEHELDALIAPTNGPAWMTDHANGDSFHIGSSSYAAVSGYPNITVPAGFVSELPIGLSFIGRPDTDKELVEIAYAFEQATLARRPPDF
jgi:amidase